MCLKLSDHAFFIFCNRPTVSIDDDSSQDSLLDGAQQTQRYPSFTTLGYAWIEYLRYLLVGYSWLMINIIVRSLSLCFLIVGKWEKVQ